MTPTPAHIAHHLRTADEALRLARLESQRITEELAESRRVRAEALPKLLGRCRRERG